MTNGCDLLFLVSFFVVTDFYAQFSKKDTEKAGKKKCNK